MCYKLVELKSNCKVDSLCLIFEESTYLVSSKEFYLDKNGSTKKMMTENLADVMVVVMGK